MKTIVATVICGVMSMAFGADEYTIQTISALKEGSITPAFEAKVKKSALVPAKVKEGACHIVTVGRYPNVKAARTDLTKAKKIAGDAFVRTVTREVPKGCQIVSEAAKGTSAVQMADANQTKPLAPTGLSGVNRDEPKPAAVLATVSCPPAEKRETASSPRTETNRVASVVVYDRDLARKSEIHEAIEYYKHSPYYSFRPIGLPR